MSQIYNICVVGHPKESENKLFAIKPNVNNFDTFKNEIFIRMPELMDHSLTFFYQGKCIHVPTCLKVFSSVHV